MRWGCSVTATETTNASIIYAVARLKCYPRKNVGRDVQRSCARVCVSTQKIMASAVSVIYSQPGMEVRRVPTREARIAVLKLDISQIPTTDEFDAAMRRIHKFFDTCPGRVVTRANIACDATPELSQVACVVSHLAQLQTLMDVKLKGTIVDLGKHHTACVDMSLALFCKMWTPTSERAKKRVFEVVGTSAAADGVLEDILAHEAKKRARREAKEGGR